MSAGGTVSTVLVIRPSHLEGQPVLSNIVPNIKTYTSGPLGIYLGFV